MSPHLQPSSPGLHGVARVGDRLAEALDLRAQVPGDDQASGIIRAALIRNPDASLSSDLLMVASVFSRLRCTFSAPMFLSDAK